MEDSQTYGKAFMTFREALKALMQMESQDLERSRELGSRLDFQPAKRIIKQVFELYRPLEESSTDDGIPMRDLHALVSGIESAQSGLQRILDFDSEISGVEERDSIIHELESVYAQTFMRVKTLGLCCSPRVREPLGPAEVTKVRSVMAEIDDIRKSIVDQRAEASTIVAGMRAAAAEAGTVEYAEYFRREAEKHCSAKYRWLAAVGVLTLILVLSAAGSVWYYATVGTADWTLPQAVQIALAKVILFSGLSYGVVLSARSYRAESHNEVVNRHRENALRTFEAFAKASKDPETQSAVLLQATQCIFSHQGSGFSQHDQDQGPSKVLEIIQRMVPRTGASSSQ